MIPRSPVTFKISITENGTNYVEEVEIDEEKELEYFHVPAHNKVAEADYVYDFKNNLAVRRVKNEAKCYVEPLPEDLPKPTDLKRAFQAASQASSSENNVVVRNYWTVSERVDKNLLRQEVQDFCGDFPVFRVEKVNLKTGISLKKRSVANDPVLVNFGRIPFCDKNPVIPTRGPNGKFACTSDQMLYKMEILDQSCTWYVTCRVQKSVKKMQCNAWTHEYNSYICYKEITCP